MKKQMKPTRRMLHAAANSAENWHKHGNLECGSHVRNSDGFF